jgi:methylenetetrahydrofolate reductase (NADPH)
MRFIDRLMAGDFAVALEVTPPQKPLAKVLLRRARLIDPLAHAVNVIQRPGRQDSLDASLALLAGGIEPVWHLVTRGRTRPEILADCERARVGGIRQVLCIRGDQSGGDMHGSPRLRDTVALVLDSIPGAGVGATFNQYAADREAALKNLIGKLRAGAAYVQTQPVFDTRLFAEAAGAIRERAPDTKIVAMVMPLRSPREAAQIQERLGIQLHEDFLRRLETEDAAWEAFEETARALVASPLVAGAAVMTFEMDPPPEIGARISTALTAAGLA